jgi:hypothetical protein
MKVILPFRDAEGKSDPGGHLWNSGEQGKGLACGSSRSSTGLIIAIMSPVHSRQKANVTPF